MSDLAAFLAARLDEDEAAAEAASERFPGPWVGAWKQVTSEPPEGEMRSVADTADSAASHHIARHDPARVLRQVAAKRAILDRHMPHETAFAGLACDWCSEDVDDRPQLMKMWWPCPDVRSIAAVYSDHPDYDPAWGPG